MITKEQLQGMSDFEVNKALAELLGAFESPPHDAPTEVLGDKLFYRDLLGNYCECHPSYCDQPNDIMPLAFEHKLNILSPDAFSSEIADGWNCFNDGGSYEVYDTNPLRAIACCLILVLEGEIG